jgi:ABC-2 type transport system permease protein
MKHSFSVIQHIVSAFLQASLEYRADFLQSVIGSLLWSFLSFASAFLLTSQTPKVFGLNRVDMLLLAATYGVVVGLHHFLCTHGFQRVPDIINKGGLDTYLLKPIDSLLVLSLMRVSWPSMIRFFGSIFLIGAILNAYQISVSIANIMSFIVLALFSFLLIYSTFTFTIIILIWHPYLSNLMELVNTAIGTARYPIEIRRYVPGPMSLVFMPTILMVNVPTMALTGRLSLNAGLLFCFVSATIFLLARLSWARALRSYSGASG